MLVKLTLGGITIEVLEDDVDHYLRAGYKRVEKPEAKPVQAPQAEKPKKGGK